jgi:hypothetical protein
MSPIWPITTLEGNFERVFAAFMTDGPKNEEPKPATVKEIERIVITKAVLEVPTRLTAAIPMMKDSPESKEARTTKNSMV